MPAARDETTERSASLTLRDRFRIVRLLRAIPIRWRILSIAALNSAVVLVLAAMIWNGAQVLRSADGKLESRPLTPAGASPLVELYELRLSARSQHASEAHAPGTHEVLVVLSGQLKLHVDSEMFELGGGDAVAFAADRPHTYENPAGSEARYHNVIVYER